MLASPETASWCRRPRERERNPSYTFRSPRRKPQILSLECPRPTDLLPPSINALKLVMQSAKDIGMSYLGNPRKYDLVPKGHFIGSEQDADRKDHLSTVPPGSPFPKRRGDAHFFRSASAAPRLVQLPANLPNYFFRTQSPAVLQSFQGSRRDAVWSSQPEMF